VRKLGTPFAKYICVKRLLGESMKYTTLLLTLSVLATTPMAVFAGDDYIIGSCEFKLTGNDVTSSFFSSDDDKIEALEESIVYKRDFKVGALSSINLTHEFERIIPFADNPNKYKDYQVILFKDDSQAKIEVFNNDVPYVPMEINGNTNVHISYGGKGETYISNRDRKKMNSRELMYKAMNSEGAPQVSVSVKGIKNGFNRPFKEKFDNDGTKSIEMEYEIPFVYKGLPGDGFWSVFKGDITELEAKEAKQKVHKSKVKVECNFSLPEEEEIAEVEENEIIKRDNEPKKKEKLFTGEFDQTKIIRKGNAVIN
jgi:hypothetical protein